MGGWKCLCVVAASFAAFDATTTQAGCGAPPKGEAAIEAAAALKAASAADPAAAPVAPASVSQGQIVNSEPAAEVMDRC